MAPTKPTKQGDDSADNLNRSQSLYRKWRSQTFGELVGQDAVTRTLRNAISAGRVGHAYLFCGPRGTGKTSTARLLAKAVNCLHKDPEKRPCNECEACLSIAQGRAMDLIEIDAASNRGIDEIRELRDKINFQPSALRKKLYIIDEVHMLTEPAFNALLKTLEEPPPHAIFVLATTDPQDIPATVVSRCQRFDFQRIGLEQIADRMKFICQQEGIKAEFAALEIVARQATGSLRDALSVLDQLIVFSGGEVTVNMVKAMLGVMNSEAVPEFVEALLQRDMASGLEQINDMVQSGTDLKRFNRELIDHLRGMMLLKANRDSKELQDLPNEIRQRMAQQAEQVDLPTLVAFLKTFSSVDYNLKVSPYAQLPLELALMEAMLARGAQPAVQPAQPAARPAPVAQAAPPPPQPRPAPAQPKAAVTPTPMPEEDDPPIDKPAASRPAPTPVIKVAPTPPPEKVAAAPTPEKVAAVTAAALEFAAVQKLWPKLKESVGVAQKMVQALLADARPIGVEEKHIILAFKYDFHLKMVSQDKNRFLIEEHYSRLLGQTTYIRCVPESGAPGGNSGGEPASGGGGPKGGGSVMDDLTRNAARIFNATVQDID